MVVVQARESIHSHWNMWRKKKLRQINNSINYCELQLFESAFWCAFKTNSAHSHWCAWQNGEKFRNWKKANSKLIRIRRCCCCTLLRRNTIFQLLAAPFHIVCYSIWLRSRPLNCTKVLWVASGVVYNMTQEIGSKPNIVSVECVVRGVRLCLALKSAEKAENAASCFRFRRILCKYLHMRTRASRKKPNRIRFHRGNPQMCIHFAVIQFSIYICSMAVCICRILHKSSISSGAARSLRSAPTIEKNENNRNWNTRSRNMKIIQGTT